MPISITSETEQSQSNLDKHVQRSVIIFQCLLDDTIIFVTSITLDVDNKIEMEQSKRPNILA